MAAEGVDAGRASHPPSSPRFKPATVVFVTVSVIDTRHRHRDRSIAASIRRRHGHR